MTQHRIEYRSSTEIQPYDNNPRRNDDAAKVVAIQLVGHADKKMIEEVYNHLKPKMVDRAKLLLDLSLNGE